MQLAVLADIHGNLPALEAILHKLRSETIDGWNVAGDMVNGPDGEKVIHVLRELDAWMILGNNEPYMLRYAHGNASTAWLTAQQFAFVRNCYRRLSAETLQILAGLPEQRLLSFDGTDPIRIIHGSLENVNGLVDPAQPETIDRLFAGAFLLSCQTGQDHWADFLKSAWKTAALVGHQDPDVIPDDIWAAAGETYFASYQ
jgi:predicted phosphodiesterase